MVLTPEGFLRGKAERIILIYAFTLGVPAFLPALFFYGVSRGSIPGKTESEQRKDDSMETRVAVISIIVEDIEAADSINTLLHEYRECIIGRMGVPYPKKGISIISVAVDGPMNAISALSGKLGALSGVSTKTVYSKVQEDK